jgi:CDP-diacylglycerol--serine O-phosphatidyltransferase
MKKHVPNLVTCLNVTCGTVAVLLVVHDRPLAAAAILLLAMVFDFLDGFLARMLRARSAMGVELDSLADVVSFGVAPALLAHVLVADALPGDAAGWERLLPWLPAVIPAFSAYRLAKFNLDTRQTRSFIGMPTPAHALFWVTLVFTRAHVPAFHDACWGDPRVLAACALFFSWLMISGLPMFSLKIPSLAWRDNRWRYPYFIVAALLLLFTRLAAVSFLIPLYVLFAVLEALHDKWRRPAQREGV